MVNLTAWREVWVRLSYTPLHFPVTDNPCFSKPIDCDILDFWVLSFSVYPATLLLCLPSCYVFVYSHLLPYYTLPITTHTTTYSVATTYPPSSCCCCTDLFMTSTFILHDLFGCTYLSTDL